MDTDDHRPPPRPMALLHVVRDALLYDQHNAGDGAGFHARPRRVTMCGIRLGRHDVADDPAAPACGACEQAVADRDEGTWP